jgi:hypothetical protein
MNFKRLDTPAILGGLRTAAALMIGNSVVVPILTNGKASLWWVLPIVGFALMIAVSIKPKKE